MKRTARVLAPDKRIWTLLGGDRTFRLSAVAGKLGGHRKTKIYGKLDCRAALRAIARGGYVKHRVFFANVRDAVAAGYRPCAVCQPDAYAKWKARKSRSRRAG